MSDGFRSGRCWRQADDRGSFAVSVIQIDELVCFGNMKDDIEFADGFKFRGSERNCRCRETLPVEWIFRPLSRRRQVFAGVVVFDQYVHGWAP